MVTLQNALMYSRNLATLNVVQLIGFNDVYNGLLRYGFSNFNNDMTIAIGSLNATPLLLAREYSIFSNYGTRVDPLLIDSVVDSHGNVFPFDTKSEFITSPEQAFLTISILKDVITNGTGRRAKVNGIEVAGKTGTTNNNIDLWFCGFTPDIQAIIWYGRDDNKSIGEYESAGLVATPVFAEFMSNVLKVEPALRRSFPIPNGVKSKTIDKQVFYYTDTSPLPNNIKQQDTNDRLLW